MDRWKRTVSGVIINDDSTGYENAKQRVISKAKKKDEMNDIINRINALEYKVHGLEMHIAQLITLCKSLVNASSPQ